MQSFSVQKASTSALRCFRRAFTRTSSCRRLTHSLITTANGDKSSSRRQFNTHPAKSTATAFLHIKSTHTHHQSRPYTTSSPSPSPPPPPQQQQEQTPQTPIVFPDPHRPDLFYHFTPPPTPLSRVLPAFALSFLDDVGSLGVDGVDKVDSPAVIGWLPAQTLGGGGDTLEGQSKEKEKGSTLDDFVGNEKFLSFLHSTIQSALEQNQDEIWRDAAIGLGKGWMHIGDQRNIPALGRVGDPDDILATVLVEDGQIIPGTYQPMPSYRICTVDGVLQLTPGLAGYLKDALIKLVHDGKN